MSAHYLARNNLSVTFQAVYFESMNMNLLCAKIPKLKTEPLGC